MTHAMYPLTAPSQARGDKPTESPTENDHVASLTAEVRWCEACGVHRAKGRLCPSCEDEEAS